MGESFGMLLSVVPRSAQGVKCFGGSSLFVAGTTSVFRTAGPTNLRSVYSFMFFVFCKMSPRKIMKKQLFGHPLKTGAYGTVPER